LKGKNAKLKKKWKKGKGTGTHDLKKSRRIDGERTAKERKESRISNEVTLPIQKSSGKGNRRLGTIEVAWRNGFLPSNNGNQEKDRLTTARKGGEVSAGRRRQGDFRGGT